MDHPHTAAPEQRQDDAPVRKPYVTPIMTDFGSVAEVTRGGFAEYFIGS